MNQESALTIVEAVGMYGLSLGIDDNWPEYLAARKLLDDPIVLRPIIIHSTLRLGSGLHAWEREVLLPVVRPLLTRWMAENSEQKDGAR